MDHQTRCAFCLLPTPADRLDHVDVPRGAVPVCLDCLGELNEWADACRAEAVDRQESGALPWEGDYVPAANDAVRRDEVA